MSINTLYASFRFLVFEVGCGKWQDTSLINSCRSTNAAFLWSPQLKPHKTNLNIPPIVLTHGGIFDRLGWFLQKSMKPFLSHMKAYSNSTTDLLTRFNAYTGVKTIGNDAHLRWRGVHLDQHQRWISHRNQFGACSEALVEFVRIENRENFWTSSPYPWQLHIWIKKQAFQTNLWTTFQQPT